MCDFCKARQTHLNALDKRKDTCLVNTYIYLFIYLFIIVIIIVIITGSSVGLPVVPSGGLSAVPIHLTNWLIRVRPQGWGLKFCTQPLEWEKASYRTASTELRSCDPLSADIANKTYSFRLVLHACTCTNNFIQVLHYFY